MAENSLESTKKETNEDQFQLALSQLIAGATGILASDKKQWVTSGGRAIQGIVAGKFLNIVYDEWQEYVSKGKIKEDYKNTDQFRSCFQEMFNALDTEIVDDKRFKIMKKVLLAAGTEKQYSRDDLLPYQYMKLARSLSSGEVIVILAVYDYVQNHPVTADRPWSARDWLGAIAIQSRLNSLSMVESYESSLIEKHLISPRSGSDQSSIHIGKHFRLTDMGVAFCQYISSYEEE